MRDMQYQAERAKAKFMEFLTDIDTQFNIKGNDKLKCNEVE